MRERGVQETGVRERERHEKARRSRESVREA